MGSNPTGPTDGESKKIAESTGPILGTVLDPQQAAIAFLLAAARGEQEAGAAAKALASAVVAGEERFRLVMEILAGGPLAIRAAVRLADLVLAPVQTAAQKTG